ncbi:hypothetical protein ANCCAN_04947 [Ancylostoma caninum]|uniref:Uncharacterized protein n=1 Tax=Ancylostoma caninum TaxID=29170 RepID=A0A368H125_ANCCA|nr:hypothetical protein ANCCAN_04947 [Ancylostoma caninum]
MCGAGTTCTVIRVKDLEQNPDKCSVLNLNTYLDDDLANDPKLYDFIKNIGEYSTFLLRGSDLQKITDLDVIKLHDGSHVSITENTHLEKLPKFEWKLGDKVFFTVTDNHKLDTTELLKKLRATKIKDANVQRPFGE